MRLLARVQAAAARGRRAARRPRARQPRRAAAAARRSRRSSTSAREQTPRVHGYAPFAGLPELRRAIAARYATHYGVELDPGARGRGRSRDEVGARRARPLPRRARRHRAAARSRTTPTTRPGIALAGAELGLLPLDPERGYAPRFDLAPRDRVAARLPQLPVEPDRGRGAGRRVRRGRRVRARDRRGDHPRLRVRRPRLRRPRAAQLPRRAGRARGRRRALLDVEELRHGRLAARLRRRQRRARRADDDAAGSRARGHLHAGAASGDRGARPARRTPSPSACGSTSGAATASSPPSGDLAAPCEGTFYVWIRLPDGLTPERLLDEHRLVVAPGEGFGPSGPAGRGCRSRRPTTCSTSASSASPAQSRVESLYSSSVAKTVEGRRRAPSACMPLHGEGRNRTGDTTVFSRVLYQLSYLAGARSLAAASR